jgi:hypothetical protein
LYIVFPNGPYYIGGPISDNYGIACGEHSQPYIDFWDRLEAQNREQSILSEPKYKRVHAVKLNWDIPSLHRLSFSRAERRMVETKFTHKLYLRVYCYEKEEPRGFSMFTKPDDFDDVKGFQLVPVLVETDIFSTAKFVFFRDNKPVAGLAAASLVSGPTDRVKRALERSRLCILTPAQRDNVLRDRALTASSVRASPKKPTMDDIHAVIADMEGGTVDETIRVPARPTPAYLSRSRASSTVTTASTASHTSAIVTAASTKRKHSGSHASSRKRTGSIFSTDNSTSVQIRTSPNGKLLKYPLLTASILAGCPVDPVDIAKRQRGTSYSIV